MSNPASSPLPSIEITIDPERGAPLPFSESELEPLIAKALPLCAASPGKHEAPFAELPEIGVVLVPDDTIARIHGEFMDDPTPTDVITFHHGEIIVSVDTAVSVAGEMQHPPLREALLYVIHGFLHLNGHHDYDPEEQTEMHRIQDAILDEVFPFPESKTA